MRRTTRPIVGRLEFDIDVALFVLGVGTSLVLGCEGDLGQSDESEHMHVGASANGVGGSYATSSASGANSTSGNSTAGTSSGGGSGGGNSSMSSGGNAGSSSSGGDVPASVFIATNGSDANPCTAAAPCKSLERAYDVAASGAVVEIANGSYPSQQVSGTKAAPAVVFRPAAGAKVVFDNLEVFATNLTIDGGVPCGALPTGAVGDCALRINGWVTETTTSDVTFKDVTHAGYFGIWSAKNLSIIGGESFCPDANNYCDYDPAITERSGSQIAPTDILIDGVWFHDWLRPAGSDWHTECLQVGAGVNVTIRNSMFVRCSTHDIFVRSWGNINGGIHKLENWVFENNFFGPVVDGYYAIQFVNDLGSFPATAIVRNNSFLFGLHIDGSNASVQVVNNIFSSQTTWDCGGEYYSHNIVEQLQGNGNLCGATDKVATVSYKDRAALDLHLLPGSPGIGEGDPASYAATDIDDEVRPLGGALDIGADEQ